MSGLRIALSFCVDVLSSRPLAIVFLATLCSGCQGEIGVDERGPASHARDGISGDSPSMRWGDADTQQKKTADGACVPEPPPLEEMSRLTREQYRATVATLFGISDIEVGQLPVDDDPLGFTRAVSGLSTNAASGVVDFSVALAQRIVATAESSLGCRGDVFPCLREGLEALLLRMFRRPPTSQEVADFDAYLLQARNEFGELAAVEDTLTVLLLSPEFLYHEHRAVNGDAVSALDGYAVASRLSYALLGTMPDELLFAAAASGALNTTEGLESEVNRILDDPRSEVGLRRFVSEWLRLGELSLSQNLTEAQRNSLRESVERQVVRVLQQGSFSDLHEDPTYLLDGTLAELYGGPATEDWTPTMLESDRAGLLAHPAILAQHAAASTDFTAIHRGVFVFKDIFCREFGSPPPDATSSGANRLTEPTCQGCHQQIDPIGYGFHAFDEFGRRIERGEPTPVEAALVSTDIDGRFSSTAELGKRIAQSEQAAACISKKMFRYMVRRAPEQADSCMLESLNYVFSQSGQDLRALVVSTILSDSFRFKTQGEG